MKEIEELLSQIDDKMLENISEPRRKLVQFLKDAYSNNKNGNRDQHA